MTIVPYDLDERSKAKMNSYDRILVLEPQEDAKVMSSKGEVDMRLFNGDNNLHAFYDVQSGMWMLKYDKGLIPGALQQKWSEFGPLLDFVRQYYQKRNVKITEVRM